MTSSDITTMHRALELAARGKGAVSPNPCVGAVIVNKGKVIGEAFHQRFGGPHAEVLALKTAGQKSKGATIYLNLEPCTHWGKTPPCAPLVIQSGIKRAVIAMKDPNPMVAGRGIQALREAGINVTVGIEEEAAQQLNRSFITWMKHKRPYVVLKMAMTLDGKIATASGNSKWVSGEASRRLVHKLRTEVDAVLVGPRTAKLDKPKLTSHGLGRNPKRVIWNGKEDIKNLLKSLAKQNVSQLMVEGGGETAWRFVKEKLVDEIYFFIAPKLVGGRSAVTPLEGEGFKRMQQALPLHRMSVSRVGEDILVHAYLKAN